jgi:hypothetical protein
MELPYYILGARLGETNTYIVPSLVNPVSTESYTCPECKQPVHLQLGTNNRAHFVHIAKKPNCMYYTRPTEEQRYKDAILRLEYLLVSGYSLKINYTCHKSKFHVVPLTYNEEFKLSEGEYIILNYKKKINTLEYAADIVIMKHDSLRLAIDVSNFYHQFTKRLCDEPRFELHCDSVINTQISIDKSQPIVFDCHRKRYSECFTCIAMKHSLGALRKSDDMYCLPCAKNSETNCVCLECKQPVEFVSISNSGNGIFRHHMINTDCSMYKFPSNHQITTDSLHKLVFLLKNKNIKYLRHPCKFYTCGEDECTDYVNIPLDLNPHDVYTIKYKENSVCISSNNEVKYTIKFVINCEDAPKHSEPNVFYTHTDVFVGMSRKYFDLIEFDRIYILNCGAICDICSKIKANLERIKNVEECHDPFIFSSIYCDDSTQNKPCVQCGTHVYIPIYSDGYRCICRKCASTLK